MSGSPRSFFRQSAGLVVATVTGGLAMMLVHTVVVKRCGPAAYAEFKALLSTFYILAAIGGGLWTLFAQQTAAAGDDPGRLGAVAGAARRVALLILGVWAILGAGLWAAQDRLMALWKLSQAGALWATWLLGLFTLWVAVARGVVQGRQNFAALGFLTLGDGFGRLAAVLGIVTWVTATAAGAMWGAVGGCALALGVGVWGGREIWGRPGRGAGARQWLGGFVPLALAAGALQAFQQYDNMFWQALIPPDQVARWNLGALYSPAQTIGFGLTQFTVPLALVMLPRLARPGAAGEAADSLRLTVRATAWMGGTVAAVCTGLPRLPLQVMFFNQPAAWAAAPVVPWVAWAMTAFTLANVYLSGLFARRRFGVVPWVVALAAGYLATLAWLRPVLLAREPVDAYRLGVQVLGVFNLGLLGVAWAFDRVATRRS
ncbi:MAG: hypothetical protein ACKO3N_03745 [Verrucomicrobiota bacterium]